MDLEVSLGLPPVHSEPAALPPAWNAPLAALAGGRPVLILDDAALHDITSDDPAEQAAADPGALVVIDADLGVIGTVERDRVVEHAATAAMVLLCAPPLESGRVRAHPPETLPEWIALLAGRGLYRSPDADLGWLPSWGVLLERTALEVPDLTRRYERLLLPMGSRPRNEEPDAARLLSLIDRVIGLEATLAEANYRRDMALLDRQEAVVAQQDLTARLAASASLVDAMRSSVSWRVGQRLVSPLRRAGRALPVPSRRHRA